jgi:hypothetical protein
MQFKYNFSITRMATIIFIFTSMIKIGESGIIQKYPLYSCITLFTITSIGMLYYTYKNMIFRYLGLCWLISLSAFGIYRFVYYYSFKLNAEILNYIPSEMSISTIIGLSILYLMYRSVIYIQEHVYVTIHIADIFIFYLISTINMIILFGIIGILQTDSHGATIFQNNLYLYTLFQFGLASYLLYNTIKMVTYKKEIKETSNVS